MADAYYNDVDTKTCAWLRELTAVATITEGIVDERSIAAIGADDVRGYRRAHFFAGIGGWEHALELADWPTGREVWTGSCPCQPFSVAGKRGGTDDARHLWPQFYRLIAECMPATVFGEQVASKDGRHWLDGVRSDLEGLGYAVGAADLCAPCAGEETEGWVFLGGAMVPQRIRIAPPHIRQRLFWVASLGVRNSSSHDERRAPMSLEYGQGVAPGRSMRDGTLGVRNSDSTPSTAIVKIQGGKGSESGRDSGIGALGIRHASEQRRQQVAESAFSHEGTNGRRENGCHVVAGSGENGTGRTTDTECKDLGRGRLYRSGESSRPDEEWTPDQSERHHGTRRTADTERTERRADIPEDERHGHDAGWDQAPSGTGTCDGPGGTTDTGVPIVCAHDLPLCECCDEPFCETHDMHYADCDCIGPGNADDYGLICVETKFGLRGFPENDAPIGCADTVEQGLERLARDGADRHEPGRLDTNQAGPVATRNGDSFWSDFDILPFADGKARRVERGTFPLVAGVRPGVVPSGDPSIQEVAHSAEGRTMRLAGYGNAIVPQVAAEFIRAFLDAEGALCG